MAELLPTPPAGSIAFKGRLLAATAAALAVAMVPSVIPAPTPSSAAPSSVSVIVREVPGAGNDPEPLVEEVGGRWSGDSWTGRSWSGRSWSGNAWSSVGWGPQ